MIFVREAKRGEAPGVLQLRIEREAVVLDRQRRTVAKDLAGAREVVAQDFLERLAPAGRAGREAAQGETYRRHVETRVQAAAAVEANFVGVQLVKIVEDAADGEAFVIVERLFKYSRGNAAAVEHQILADIAAAIGEAIGKLLVGGEQEQTRSFRAVRADDDGFGFLALDVSPGVEINGAGGAAGGVKFDAMNVGIRADFAAAGFFGHANRGGEGAGCCADFATERQTEAAIDTSAASGARLGKYGHGRGKWMPAEFARGAFENYTAGFHREWRHGISLRARRIERAGVGLARDADLPFNSGVVGLEVGVGYGPIGESGARDRTHFAALDEIDFVEAPEIRREMRARAADQAAVDQSALRFGFVLGRFSKSCWLKLRMIRQKILVEDFYFVVNKIFLGEVRALFENDHVEAVAGQFLGEDAAGGTGADDDEIDFISCFVFGLIEHHDLVFSPSGGFGCQPG